jgi:predicted DNA-binding transcriptional regulator
MRGVSRDLAIRRLDRWPSVKAAYRAGPMRRAYDEGWVGNARASFAVFVNVAHA